MVRLLQTFKKCRTHSHAEHHIRMGTRLDQKYSEATRSPPSEILLPSGEQEWSTWGLHLWHCFRYPVCIGHCVSDVSSCCLLHFCICLQSSILTSGCSSIITNVANSQIIHLVSLWYDMFRYASSGCTNILLQTNGWWCFPSMILDGHTKQLSTHFRVCRCSPPNVPAPEAVECLSWVSRKYKLLQSDKTNWVTAYAISIGGSVC